MFDLEYKKCEKRVRKLFKIIKNMQNSENLYDLLQDDTFLSLKTKIYFFIDNNLLLNGQQLLDKFNIYLQNSVRLLDFAG